MDALGDLYRVLRRPRSSRRTRKRIVDELFDRPENWPGWEGRLYDVVMSLSLSMKKSGSGVSVRCSDPDNVKHDACMTFLEVAIKSPRRLPADPEKLPLWIAGVGRNLTLTEYRRHRALLCAAPLEDHAHCLAVVSPEYDDQVTVPLSVLAEIRRAIAGLTPALRRIARLAFVQGLRSVDIARKLKEKPGTVRQARRRALAAIRAALEAKGIRPPRM